MDSSSPTPLSISRAARPFRARVFARGLLAWSVLAATLPAQSAPPTGPTSGRVLWLRADRSVLKGVSDLVHEWRDPGGIALAQTDGHRWPEWRAAGIGGQPALHFDGNDFLYSATGMPTGSYTEIAVVSLDDLSAANNVIAGVSNHALVFGGTDRAKLFHSGIFVTSARPVTAVTPIVLVATYDAATHVGRLYQDGALVGVGTDRVGNQDPTLLIGSFDFGWFLHGSIAEVMLYDRVLTSSDLDALHRYLLTRYESAFPRVSFTALPQPAQVLQRDAGGHSIVTIEGDVLTPSEDRIEVEIDRNQQLWQSLSQPLQYAGNSAHFLLQPSIDAGLFDWSATVRVVKGSRSDVVAAIGNLACGDVFLVNGQSNAAAADFLGEGLANAMRSHWIRSYGTASKWGDVSWDLHWDLADGQIYLGHATIGQWAIKLASRLVNDEQLPIAILNGAVGATSSAQHLRNDQDPEDLSTVYGRLLYRADHAGILQQVPILLWYQGESDGSDGTTWFNNFVRLHASWKADFPGLVGVDLFQIRSDCDGTSGIEVQERQREVPGALPDCYVMSTTAAPGHNGCHFDAAGYFELGNRLARVLERDRYGSGVTQNVDAPAIVDASWSDPMHTQILLTFSDPNDLLHLDPGAQANFVTDDGVPVVSGSSSGDTILLQLAGPSAATTIDYDGHAFDGPWLANARNVGALTFQRIPIH